jgi:hypothetical protein
MRTLVTLTLVAVSGLLPAAAATGSDSKPRLHEGQEQPAHGGRA